MKSLFVFLSSLLLMAVPPAPTPQPTPVPVYTPAPTAQYVPAQSEIKEFAVRNGDREQKRVAITMDDCYGINNVRAAFELYERYDAPITFFALGSVYKPEDAELWRSIAESACEIGNHTYDHKSLTDLDTPAIYTQLSLTQISLNAVLGYNYPMQVMRPPNGDLSRGGRTVSNAIRGAGYDHAILWDIDSTDPAACLQRVKNGSILVFHANAKDIACLETLLPQLIEQGYKLVTVSEMIGKPPVVPTDEPYIPPDYYE